MVDCAETCPEKNILTMTTVSKETTLNKKLFISQRLLSVQDPIQTQCKHILALILVQLQLEALQSIKSTFKLTTENESK
ncbi:CLUMA_CG021441, isoform A [Clunio marinus]|uniref:CLUMA_CG021441, isoform A n=1 Tax=Clunio marinus TaxID=568069 RepID=A0A1J1J7Y2_9DIPT|nr:CLUMA_CG021441, isoform A [Clunio marinus]